MLAGLFCPLAAADGWKHEVQRRFKAEEANQGVAVDDLHFYAITNHAIGKYRKDTGERVASWDGGKGGMIKHLNAGVVLDGKLWCAHSNFPELPEQSSVEIWDTSTMQHVDGHRFEKPPGSLTWVDRRGDAWFACFAHYKKASDPALTSVVKFDANWQPLAKWTFPARLIERFAGNSSSGGSFGPGGQLFVTGHDARELYVLDVPETGGELVWRDTVPITAAGQAFAWDRKDSGILYSIQRKTKEVIVSRVSRNTVDMPSAVAPPYYSVRYEASGKPGELAMPVTYAVWIPEKVKTLRGVIVHQHGCGKGSGVTGRTAAFDLHWQALARKWDCALLGPAYDQLTDKDCRNWCDPRNGSDASFQKALKHFAEESKHPELATVPWCLWGHSGGGFWSSLMLTLHPERIAAIFYRSGSAYAIWERGEIPRPVLTPAVYEVPFMFIGGVKEAQDKSHGPARIGDRAMLKAWREHGAPGGLASDPLSGHECGDSRYLAIAFFDACLAQRLPEAGGGVKALKPVDLKLAWLAARDSNSAQPAAEFKGDKAAAHWLPDATFAKAWMSYNRTGRPADTTPPPAPVKVRLSDDGELTWNAEADLESGLGGFIIERDGKEIARLPEKPVGKSGTPLFQGLNGGDTPVIALPSMSYRDGSATPGEKHRYAVRSVNAVGLASLPGDAIAEGKP